MNKQEFLDELDRLAGGLSAAERRQLRDYYGEMIDDRVEEGVPEEEAVAALGAPEDLARELPLPSGASVGGEGDRNQSVAALSGLRARVYNADVSVVKAPLANGAAAQLRFSNPERFSWRMDGETLEITEREEGGRKLFRLRQPSVTVTLPEGLAGAFDFEGNGGDLCVDGAALGGEVRVVSASGDIAFNGVRCGADARLHSRSGDIELRDTRVAGGLEVTSASGDIEAVGLSVEGAAALETASGDIELRNPRCGELRLSATSGDIELDRGLAGSTVVRAASGDVRLDELESDPELSVETSSGDIALARCIARQTRLRSASGDVSLRLAALPCGYDINADTRSGDIHLPGDVAPAQPGVLRPQIRIETVSGDIDARIVE